MRGESLKGHLDLLVLAVFTDGPLHGYGVIRALRQRSSAALDLPEGTVYPLLHRLERQGLLASRWRSVERRRRRLYSLTAAGWRALDRRRKEWAAFASTVQAVLEPSG